MEDVTFFTPVTFDYGYNPDISDAYFLCLTMDYEHYVIPQSLQWFLLIMNVLAIVFNICVCYVYSARWKFLNSFDLFMLGLSSCSLAVCLLFICHFMVIKYLGAEGEASAVYCTLVVYFYETCIIAGLVLTLVISMMSLFSVLFPYRQKTLQLRRVGWKIVVFALIVSLIAASPSFMYRDSKDDIFGAMACNSVTELFSAPSSDRAVLAKFLILVTLYALNFVGLLVSYSYILLVVRRLKESRGRRSQGGSLMLILVLFLLLMYTPSLICEFLYTLVQLGAIELSCHAWVGMFDASKVLKLFVELHAVFNPALYLIFSKRFGQHLLAARERIRR